MNFRTLSTQSQILFAAEIKIMVQVFSLKASKFCNCIRRFRKFWLGQQILVSIMTILVKRATLRSLSKNQRAHFFARSSSGDVAAEKELAASKLLPMSQSGKWEQISWATGHYLPIRPSLIFFWDCVLYAFVWTLYGPCMGPVCV